MNYAKIINISLPLLKEKEELGCISKQQGSIRKYETDNGEDRYSIKKNTARKKDLRAVLRYTLNTYRQ